MPKKKLRPITEIPAFQIVVAVIGISLFGMVLVSMAKLGIRMAENDLPEAAKRTSGYPIGLMVIAGQDGEPVFLSSDGHNLRRFYFAYNDKAKRREAADLEEYSIRRVFSAVEVVSLKADADVVQVQIRTGALADSIYWIHISQLPSPESIPSLSPVPAVSGQ